MTKNHNETVVRERWVEMTITKLIRCLLTSGLLGLVLAAVSGGAADALMTKNHNETVVSER